MERTDAVVIGAGVIGLAVGRALAREGLETIVLERADGFGTVTSSRNSEVIHAGLYYPRGSLKARLCVAGRERLYAYCEAKGIAHRRCGKLLVATGEAQIAKLAHIHAQGQGNGVDDLQWLDAAQLRTLEPQLRADVALRSPSTGERSASAPPAASRSPSSASMSPWLSMMPVEGDRSATSARN